MCNGFNSRNLLRYSTLVYQGRLYNQPVTVRFCPSASHLSSAKLQHWLDGLSQLSHPHVLPILGACLQPAIIICPAQVWRIASDAESYNVANMISCIRSHSTLALSTQCSKAA